MSAPGAPWQPIENWNTRALDPRTIEECAKVADDYDGDGMDCKGYNDHLGDAHKTRRDIAAAIRALRGTKP